jgi:hypothetical protein
VALAPSSAKLLPHSVPFLADSVKRRVLSVLLLLAATAFCLTLPSQILPAKWARAGFLVAPADLLVGLVLPRLC